MTFDKNRIEAVQQLLKEAKQIAIVAHKSPDGDSIGSSLGLFHYLKKRGHNVIVCQPDKQPYFLDWLNGAELMKNGEDDFEEVHSIIQQSAIIFCLDFNDFSRTGGLENSLRQAKATKIMIDHHLNPSQDFDYTFSEPTSCSTAQLIFDFIEAMGDGALLDKFIGEGLYCGIMTDSGSFRFPSVTAHTHQVISRLIAAGVEPYKIHEAIYDTNTFDKLRLHSFAINERTEIVEEAHTAITYLTKEDLERFNYVKGDTEGLVNVGLSITGIRKSIFLMEHDGIIKISFRSKGEDNLVNTIASKYFNGGGHANASGGNWRGTMKEAIQKVKEVIVK